MNHKHLNALCLYFNLGLAKQEPQRVHGGLLHIMWRLDTDKGTYAIKELSEDIIPDERVSRISENIASRFIAHGIPAVCAIEKSGKYLFMIDETGYLVYPWVDAKIMDSEEHALKIAAILAKMHRINLEEPAITQPEFYTHTDDKILELIDKAERFNCSFAKDLQKNKNKLLAANEAYHNAIPTLKEQIVVSHGDLDQKNVLWDSNGNPILIDWESACKINPTYDIINTAFYWSGITTHFNTKLFFKMLDAYQQAGGVINKDHVACACAGVLNVIGWLIRNIERSCVKGESTQKTQAIEQVNQTLAMIIKLQTVIPDVALKIISHLKQ